MSSQQPKKNRIIPGLNNSTVNVLVILFFIIIIIVAYMTSLTTSLLVLTTAIQCMAVYVYLHRIKDITHDPVQDLLTEDDVIEDTIDDDAIEQSVQEQDNDNSDGDDDSNIVENMTSGYAKNTNPGVKVPTPHDSYRLASIDEKVASYGKARDRHKRMIDGFMDRSKYDGLFDEELEIEESRHWWGNNEF